MRFFQKEKNDKSPNRIVLSRQAYLSIVSEVSVFSGRETGGIFLGTIEDNTWYIIESIDPGYHETIREQAYFVYDVDYINHLANIRYRLYNRELILLGLWHRHPGSMDVFSGADRETNKKFVENCTNGSISALINIDPLFRISMYYISPDLHYTKIKNIEHGNNYIPGELLELKDPKVFLDKINNVDKKNNDAPSKFQKKLLSVFENEYTGYLSQQKNYEYEIRLTDNTLELDMKRIDDNFNIPSSVFIEFFVSSDNRIGIRFNRNKKEVYEYKENMIRLYIDKQNKAVQQKSVVDKSLPYGAMIKTQRNKSVQ
jgi:proteasome lid subunit RPN8/RPN11